MNLTQQPGESDIAWRLRISNHVTALENDNALLRARIRVQQLRAERLRIERAEFDIDADSTPCFLRPQAG